MPGLEQRYYEDCISNGKPYFGPILGSSQGLPVRHAYMRALVRDECQNRNDKALHILEIGSWAGGSTITWANALRSYNGGRGFVVCIDPWRPYFDPNDYSDLPDFGQYAVMADALRSEKIYELFMHNIRSSGNEELVVPFRGKSSDLLGFLRDSRFDLIFVDGAHDYSNVMLDIVNSVRLISEGGIICGDDLELQTSELNIQYAEQNKNKDYVLDPQENRWYHPGVSLAVGEFFGEVSAWEGFWAMRRENGAWKKLNLNADESQIPEHMEARLPHLVEEGYKGFNIVRYSGSYYALAMSIGPFDLSAAPEEVVELYRNAGRCFIEKSVDEIKSAVDADTRANL